MQTHAEMLCIAQIPTNGNPVPVPPSCIIQVSAVADKAVQRAASTAPAFGTSIGSDPV